MRHSLLAPSMPVVEQSPARLSRQSGRKSSRSGTSQLFCLFFTTEDNISAIPINATFPGARAHQPPVPNSPDTPLPRQSHLSPPRCLISWCTSTNRLTLSPTLASLNPILSILPESFVVILSAMPQETADLAALAYMFPVHIVHLFDHHNSSREVTQLQVPIVMA
jgi:hypothetical protein